jgi:hypothetical protein
MKPWTDDEKKLIRLHYRETGTRVLRTLLPDRTPSGIRLIANSMELTYAKARHNKKAVAWTPKEDAIIRSKFPLIRMRGDSMTLEKLAEMLGKTPLQTRYRAMNLGLTRMVPKQPDWTDDEKEFVAEHVYRSVAWIREALRRKGYPRRSESSIATMRCRINCAVVGNGVVYSACELGYLMGKDSRQVTLWIKQGLLKAKPRTDSIDPRHGGVGDRWEIKPADVRTFIFKHPAYLDLPMVDKNWFLTIMEDQYIPRPRYVQENCGVPEASGL